MRNLPIFQRTLGTGQSKAEKVKLKKPTSELVMGNGFVSSEVSGSMNKFLEKYETGEKVGEGTDGVVRVCYHKEKKKRYTVKSMRMEEEQVVFLKRNFLSITHLHHCNVIKYQRLYLDMKRHTANLVMEYETMKPLSTFSHFTQGKLKSIMKQLL
jgi:serine/threonine protein kinase